MELLEVSTQIMLEKVSSLLTHDKLCCTKIQPIKAGSSIFGVVDEQNMEGIVQDIC